MTQIQNRPAGMNGVAPFKISPFLICAICAICGFSVPAANLEVVSQDLVASALKTTKVTLTPLSYPSNSSALVAMAPKTATTDSNGIAWFSNALPAYYRLDLAGTPPTSFRILVPDTNGTVLAHQLVTAPTNIVNGSSVAYSISAADARFATPAQVTNIAQAVGGSGSGGVSTNLLNSTSNTLALADAANLGTATNLVNASSNTLHGFLNGTNDALIVSMNAALNALSNVLYNGQAAEAAHATNADSAAYAGGATNFLGVTIDGPTNLSLAMTAGSSHKAVFSFRSFGSFDRLGLMDRDDGVFIKFNRGLEFYDPDNGTNLSAKIDSFGGIFSGDGSGLTNVAAATVSGDLSNRVRGSNILGQINATNMPATLENPLYTSAASASNGPSGNELVNASFVRGLFEGSGASYYVSAVTTLFTNADTADLVYASIPNPIPTNGFRRYASFTNNQYVGSTSTTNRFQQVGANITVNSYLENTNSGNPAISLHAEIYVSYNGTNWTEIGSSTAQALAIRSTNLYQWVISNQGYASTNANGFYLMRRLKIDSQNLSPTLVVHYGTNNPSHMSLPGVEAASGQAFLVANQTFTGANTFSQTISGSISGNATTATTATNLVGFTPSAAVTNNDTRAITLYGSSTFGGINAVTNVGVYGTLTINNGGGLSVYATPNFYSGISSWGNFNSTNGLKCAVLTNTGIYYGSGAGLSNVSSTGLSGILTNSTSGNASGNAGSASNLQAGATINACSATNLTNFSAKGFGYSTAFAEGSQTNLSLNLQGGVYQYYTATNAGCHIGNVTNGPGAATLVIRAGAQATVLVSWPTNYVTLNTNGLLLSAGNWYLWLTNSGPRVAMVSVLNDGGAGYTNTFITGGVTW